MKDKPLFSVITVVLNDRSGFVETARSIALQREYASRFGIEFVVIDGASTDGTLDEIERDKNNIDIVVSEPDRGLYDAMNKGVGMCGGEYLIFLNAGDAFATEMTLAEIGNRIVEEGFPDFVFGDAYETTATGERLFKKARSSDRIWYGMFTHHQAMLYRRDRVGPLRYRLEYPVAADYAFTAEFLTRAEAVLQLSFPVCTFVQGGLSSRARANGMREQWGIRRDIMAMSFPARVSIRIIHGMAHFLKGCCPLIYKKLRFS